jgi:heat shock protein HslJ
MKQLLRSFSIAAVLVIVTGCQSSSPVAGNEMDLTGTAWVAQEIEGQSVVSRAEPTLEFGRERLTGSTGCNRYDAPLFITINGNQLQTGKANLTRNICRTELMGQELRFLTALAATTAYHTEDDRLLLVDAQEVAHMRLTRVVISLRAMVCSDGIKAISIVMRPAGKDAIEVVMPDAIRHLDRVSDIVSETVFSDGHTSIKIGGDGTVMLEIAGQRYSCSEK